jgi:hypothetical protein
VQASKIRRASFIKSALDTLARTTVLIAPAEAIPALRQQPFLQESMAFSEADADIALEQIRRHVPMIIAVEREFGASPAGQAFFKQLHADPNLATCQIQMVGVRRSQRYRVNKGVLLDGTAATLLDISTTGAHLISSVVLKPGQEVYVTLRSDNPPVLAVAVWVQYELPREGPQYRAGIQFAPSAAAAVAEYISQQSP